MYDAEFHNAVSYAENDQQGQGLEKTQNKDIQENYYHHLQEFHLR